MDDLEVRQLRYFVAVAEELHFGRAARRLGMAQPPLSRAIRELERGLGVRLLDRTTRHVALTPAGEVLLREGRTALDAVSAAARRTRHAGRPTPALRLALKADFDAGLLPAMLAEYQRTQGLPPVELVLGGRGDQAVALRDGRADVALLPGPAEAADLDSEPLVTETRVVALTVGDELAARAELRLADFAGRVLPDGSPAEEDGTGTATTTGFRPRDVAEIFNMVELGRMVWFLPGSLARRHPRPGVAYRPVTDLPPFTLSVAWPRNSRSRAVAAFVRAATGVAGSPVGAQARGA
ncbi:LysR family transcriptional regulator [Saccharothrix sp. NPDC042600]|uniref:LysR family transcriptional regulator n=1 Tax=Saccharothrix TaxID=2071 RepID=UPI0033F20A83|nr:LysR family transcriptional regulator [Saccharothrix mutabilis subsp. capreolus]